MREQWCIPPKANAAFVYHMEDVLEVYTRPYDARHPVVCMDEMPVHLRRQRLPGEAGRPGQVERTDYQYDPQGVCNVFVASDPLAGKRYLAVTQQHTARDWALFMREVIEEHYAGADRIVLVLDNLVTHTPASFYKVFPPQEARRLTDKLDLHYTPKHGSWLNMAEIEFSALARQCLWRPIESQEAVTQQVAAWQAPRNAATATIEWRFTTADARIKLKRLYPVF